MNLIKKGSRGNRVRDIQKFLVGSGYSLGEADGVFGKKTKEAVKKYQSDNGLVGDGIIGNRTLGAMLTQGLALLPDTSDFPPKPDFPPLVGNTQRQKIFGKFDYVPAPTNGNPEGIKILGSWVAENIVTVDLPQLAKATNGKFTRMRFHKKAADQLRGLWSAWEKEGLLKHVLSYEGAFYPRYVRGSRRTLSNHSWGTAMDLNYRWNKLGRIGAQVGEKGSVRELVPLAVEYGFYWGGWFSRSDPMHIEIAKVL